MSDEIEIRKISIRGISTPYMVVSRHKKKRLCGTLNSALRTTWRVNGFLRDQTIRSLIA